MYLNPEKTLEVLLTTEIDKMLSYIRYNSTNTFYQIAYIVSHTGKIPFSNKEILDSQDLTNYEKIILIKTKTSFEKELLLSERNSIVNSEFLSTIQKSSNKPLTQEQQHKLQLCKDDLQFEIAQCNIQYNIISLFVGVLGIKNGKSEGIGWAALGFEKVLGVARSSCRKNANHNYEMCLINNKIPLTYK